MTEALLLHENASITDREQAFLIREFVRFLSHKSVGVNGYTNMPLTWKEVVDTAQTGGHQKVRDLSLIVTGWHQKVRDLSLQLSKYLGRKIDIRLSRDHENKPEMRVQSDLEALSKRNELRAEFRIPDAASNMVIIADLRAQVIKVSMVVDAPLDKKKTTTRVNWLLRQIKTTEPEGVIVRIKWAFKSKDSDVSLSALLADPQAAEKLKPKALPRAFEVILSKAYGSRFNGRRTFIEEVEDICPKFYETIGQNLRSWQPLPPKPRHPSEPKLDKETETPNKRIPPAGNEYTDLLKIPPYLGRMRIRRDEGSSPIPKENRERRYSQPSRFRSHFTRNT